jgi:hypothetical protein
MERIFASLKAGYEKFSWQHGVGVCIVIFVLLSLHACRKDAIPVLPEGMQTLEGTLQPVALSMVRRGTHLLMQNGESVYYVESTQVNLHDYEEQQVVLTGMLELNADKTDLPVLVASGATLVEESLKEWDVSSLSLSLTAPEEWDGYPTDSGIRFTASGSAKVLLSISYQSGGTLPQGQSQPMNGKRAVRVTSTGSDVVYVQNGARIVIFNFTPRTIDTAGQRLFNRILRSAQFTTPSSRASGTGSANGSAGSATTGMPCGGPAGVLCPAGQYCEVTDNVTDIGRCRVLKR